MTITARYPGTCSKCGQPIHPGQSIEWEHRKRSCHTQCPEFTGIDGYAATSAFLKASPEAQERFAHTDRDGYDTRQSKHHTCRRCGQGGYAGSYPFSTYGGDICDDCGA